MAASSLTVQDGHQAIIVDGPVAALIRWLIRRRTLIEQHGEPRRVTFHIKDGCRPRAEVTLSEELGGGCS